MSNGNPNAFPIASQETGEWFPGMTLRDWFAGMALQGFAPHMLEVIETRVGDKIVTRHRERVKAVDIVHYAYELADHMLAARSAEGSEL